MSCRQRGTAEEVVRSPAAAVPGHHSAHGHFITVGFNVTFTMHTTELSGQCNLYNECV